VQPLIAVDAAAMASPELRAFAAHQYALPSTPHWPASRMRLLGSGHESLQRVAVRASRHRNQSAGPTRTDAKVKRAAIFVTWRPQDGRCATHTSSREAIDDTLKDLKKRGIQDVDDPPQNPSSQSNS